MSSVVSTLTLRCEIPSQRIYVLYNLLFQVVGPQGVEGPQGPPGVPGQQVNIEIILIHRLKMLHTITNYNDNILLHWQIHLI